MMYFLLCAERCLLRCREAKIHDAICLFDEAGGSCNCCALTSFCHPSAGMHGLRITDLVFWRNRVYTEQQPFAVPLNEDSAGCFLLLLEA